MVKWQDKDSQVGQAIRKGVGNRHLVWNWSFIRERGAGKSTCSPTKKEMLALLRWEGGGGGAKKVLRIDYCDAASFDHALFTI